MTDVAILLGWLALLAAWLVLTSQSSFTVDRAGRLRFRPVTPHERPKR